MDKQRGYYALFIVILPSQKFVKNANSRWECLFISIYLFGDNGVCVFSALTSVGALFLLRCDFTQTRSIGQWQKILI